MTNFLDFSRKINIAAKVCMLYNFLTAPKYNIEKGKNMKDLKNINTAKGKLTYTVFSEERDGSERYGIAVSSGIFGETETASVHDITTDISFAEGLASLLADNLVLPSTLSEVVEEYLAVKFTVH